MTDVWVRPELKGSDNLISLADFGTKHGMLHKNAMASRLKSYADKAPKVVRITGRTRYYLESDLEKFLEVTSNPTPRTAKEVAQAEAAYLKQAIQELEAGMRKHDGEVALSQYNVRRAQEALDKKKAARKAATTLLNKRKKQLEIARARMSLPD